MLSGSMWISFWVYSKSGDQISEAKPSVMPPATRQNHDVTLMLHAARHTLRRMSTFQSIHIWQYASVSVLDPKGMQVFHVNSQRCY